MTYEHRCDALDWKLTEKGKDYVQCDGSKDVQRVWLEGLLFGVEVHLCQPHRAYFTDRLRWKIQKPGGKR